MRLWLEDLCPPLERWAWKIVEEAKAMLADGGAAEASLDHDLDKTREPTSGLEPLIPAHYE